VTCYRRKLRNSRAGQELVEFAAVTTAFLLLVFGLMYLGSAVYYYNTLSSAAREAVRYAIAHSPTSAAPATTQQIQQVAINDAAGLNPKELTVEVSWPSDPNLPLKKDAQVQVSYEYKVSIPFLNQVTFNLTSTSRMLVSQ
jgi:Flp pilus assembly protein TadG